MKLTLIRPGIGSKKNGLEYEEIGAMEPYALALIAGLTPPDVEVKLVDDRMETINFDEETNLVAINVETFTAKRAYRIAREFRERDIPVIMGGFHASMLPDEALEHADSVVAGEAEPVWETVISDFRAGKLKRIYESGFKCDMSGYKPDRSIYKDKKYLPITLTHFSRGCPYRCTFCPDATLYEGRLRFRPVEDVVADIESQDRDFVFFVDNNITTNRKRFKELLIAIEPLKVKWISQGDINMGQDEEMLKLMKKSGCLGLVIGIETLDFNNLSMMNKPQNISSFARYDDLIKRIHWNGISIWAAFLLGYDSDTTETFQRVLDFALKHKFFIAGFNPLIPYCGTPIYEQLKSEGRLLYDKWWLDPNFRFGDVVYRPRNMLPEQLMKGVVEMRDDFDKPFSILKRASNFRSNLRNIFKMGLFAKYSALLKEELRNKHQLELGE
ncbi:MAG: B12-binding domain-containing radical SAM protein [bacterium]|nr:B12-binding domain-containing radical SAM protein [bacterium]